MTTNTNTISTTDLVKAGGGTPDKSQPVTFKGHQFNAPSPWREDPMGSKKAYNDEVDAIFEDMNHTEEFAGFGFNDVAVNLHRVMQQLDGGVVRSVRTSPMKLPAERTVETGYDRSGNMTYATIPGDWMTVPNLKNAMVTAAQNPDGSGYVAFRFKRYEHEAILGILVYLRQQLAENSIYRGQVIDINYEYINVTKFDITKVVYNEDIGDMLNTWCVSTLRNGAINEAAGLKTKVSACLAGPPGTGKTMFIAMAHSITFQLGGTAVVIPSGSGLGGFEKGMQIMRTYMTPEAPSLVTFEDIETLNAAYRSKLLELFDGATGKNDRVLLLTTTNTPEVLEPALLRPGRIDALIPIELPDLGAFTKLIQMQLGEMLAEDVDFEAAFPAFEGYTSAWIVGSAEIVIRGAIARTGKFQGLKISTRDLVVAANSYRPQFEMQNRSANREEELPTLDQALQHMVYNAMEKVADNYSFTTHDDNTDYYEVKSKVEEAIREDVGDIVCEAIDEKLHGAKIVKGDYGQEIKTN